MTVTACGIEVENLRGFRRTHLDLTRHITLLVGPNNSGKTSLLRLMDWVFNRADEDLLRGLRDLTPEEESLLIPARNTRGGARRLVLLVAVPDGRRHARFFAQAGIARVRFRVRGARVYLNVRPPTRSEPLTYEQNAIDLLDEVREGTHFKLIPASRDASSTTFVQTLTSAMEAKLRERAVHRIPAGAPIEYRQLSAALTDLRNVAEQLTQPLWNEMRANIPPGLAREGIFRLDIEAADLVEWLATKVAFRLTTGEHDEKSVIPVEVGSGLQSLIDIAVLRGAGVDDVATQIIGFEEPEAFLHPAAQRSLARALFNQQTTKLIVSTHSPVIVDEAQFGAVMLVRDHRIFAAAQQNDAQRDEINTALMTGQGSEAIFARSVLFVEGDGDAQFFEALRRRVTQVDESGRADSLSVIRAGSNSSFAPWIRLVESYADVATGDKPIEWLAVADAVDAITPLRSALRHAEIPVAQEIEQMFSLASQAHAGDDEALKLATTRRLNAGAIETGLRVHFLPFDLEYCLLQAATPVTINRLCRRCGIRPGGQAEVLRRLGSKFGEGPINDARKDPWMRGIVGRELPWPEVADDAKDVLRRWLLPAYDSDTNAVATLFRRLTRVAA